MTLTATPRRGAARAAALRLPGTAPDPGARPTRPHSSSRRHVLLLGPQRKRPIVETVLAERGIRGRVATITAGRQEAEGELDELGSVAARAVDLRLHARADAIFAADPQLASAHRTRQEILRSMRRLYDLRLAHAIAALVELELREGPPEALEWERHEAMEALRELDARHLARVREVQAEWEPRLDARNRPALLHHRTEVARILATCEALLVAGGHVAVLVNRMRFFDIVPAIPAATTVVGWAAGAMALTERIVVYHDNPPWGLGNAEAFDTGLGLARGVVALPDARRRQRLDDPARLSRFARRFEPAMAVTLEEEDVLVLGPDGPEGGTRARYLAIDGTLQEVGP